VCVNSIQNVDFLSDSTGGYKVKMPDEG